MILVFDQETRNRPWPNCRQNDWAPGTPEWQHYSRTWPYTEPVQLWEYCKQEQCDLFQICSDIDQAPAGSMYPIAVSFFDHEVDWFSLMPAKVVSRLRDETLEVLFWYSEGDNPMVIRHVWDQLCFAWNINPLQVKIVTANTTTDIFANGTYFCDDELLYRSRNSQVPAEIPHKHPRTHRFTVLSRISKWWRATVMSDLYHHGVHQNSYFSYNTVSTPIDRAEDNPISVNEHPGLRAKLETFLKHEPFCADSLSEHAHNDHTHHVSEHYANSYINIVLETHMDADRSGGAFITEKTFKPIKHGQPFIIVGTPFSLNVLKRLGYRTFDSVFDNSYDEIEDTNKRYSAVIGEIKRLNAMSIEELHNVYEKCLPDIIHNQQLFLATKQDRLNSLVEKLF